MAQAAVSVIIATALEPARVDKLAAAVASILSQPDCAALPIIVVNGDRYDPAALAAWQSRSDVRLLQLADGDTLKARLYGRWQVDTEFFAALDDDDIFLPRGLSVRLARLRRDPAIDVVVGNGLIDRDGREGVMLSRLDLHRRSPLIGLAIENWMPSACAALFRTASVGPEFFATGDQGMEWTALGFRLVVAERKIAFLDELTYRIADTPGSLSKTLGYNLAARETLRRLLDQPLPYAARQVWQRKYGATLHWLADLHRSRGEMRAAWGAHLRSLAQPGGMRYLAFSRKLMHRGTLPDVIRLPVAR